MNFPTRNENTLDLVFSNDMYSICDLQSLPPLGNSDHCIVYFTTTINPPLSSGDSKVINKSRCWRRANFDAINFELSLINWNSIFQFCFNVHQCYDTFINILNDLCDKYVPPIKSNSTPTLSSKGSSVKH